MPEELFEKRHTCRVCELQFLVDEAGFRFSLKRKMCIRCIVDESVKNGELKLPDCYGKEYNGANDLCYNKCTVREACIITMVDRSATNWNFSDAVFRKTFSKMRASKKASEWLAKLTAIKILRIAGRPMHFWDLAPIVEKLTDGGYTMKSTDGSLSVLRPLLYRSDDVVALGENVYVWRGIWNPEDGGRPTWGSLGKRDPEVKDLDQILAELPGEPTEKDVHAHDAVLSRKDQFRLRQLIRQDQNITWRSDESNPNVARGKRRQKEREKAKARKEKEEKQD